MKKLLQVLFLSCFLILSGCSESTEPAKEEKQQEVIKEESKKDETKDEVIETYEASEDTETFSVAELPPYTDTPYVEINNNVPEFETYEIQEATTSYEKTLEECNSVVFNPLMEEYMGYRKAYIKRAISKEEFEKLVEDFIKKEQFIELYEKALLISNNDLSDMEEISKWV